MNTAPGTWPFIILFYMKMTPDVDLNFILFAMLMWLFGNLGEICIEKIHLYAIVCDIPHGDANNILGRFSVKEELTTNISYEISFVAPTQSFLVDCESTCSNHIELNINYLLLFLISNYLLLLVFHLSTTLCPMTKSLNIYIYYHVTRRNLEILSCHAMMVICIKFHIMGYLNANQ